MVKIRYQGDELDLFAAARTWRDYWTQAIAEYLRGDVLEVGAGVGSVTRLLHGRSRTWQALEPDPRLAERISAWSNAARPQNVTASCGTIADLPEEARYDAILYADVLEHIEDDAAELQQAFGRLRGGGTLVVLGPAHQELFSPFDQQVGHYRRYDVRSLRAISPPGSDELTVKYLDSVGMLASVANRIALRSSRPTARQIRMWDQRMVPISRIIDPVVGYRLGKSVVMVWTKNPMRGTA